LAYLLEMGPHELTIAKQAMRAGKGLPERIANAPELEAGLDLYLNAFFDLDSERAHGHALGPIPWTKIREYAKAFDFDDDLQDHLFFYVKAMDNEHLKRIARQTKNGQSK
jgi:hypothetical protein